MTAHGRRPRRADPRTVLAGTDPGLTRLRAAGTTMAAVVVGAGLGAVVRALAPAAPVSMLLVAGILAMFSSLVVTGQGRARRITGVLLIVPAAGGLAIGTIAGSYRYGGVEAVVVVAVAAVWVRRFGPRWFSLGMIAFFAVFLTQILRTTTAALPWLVLGAALGILASIAVREVLFRERPERTLRRVLGALRARGYALVLAAEGVVAELAATGDGRRDAALAALQHAQERFTETALAVSDLLEQPTEAPVPRGVDPETVALQVVEIELVMERLAVSVARLAGADHAGAAPPRASTLTAPRVALVALSSALLARADTASRLAAAEDARGAVAGLLADPCPPDDRVRRVAVAIRLVADAARELELRAHEASDRSEEPGTSERGPDPADRSEETRARDVQADSGPASDPSASGGLMASLAPSTRQAIQVGLSLVLTIAVSELIAPSRWYWAVIAAFVVFTGAQSRGDLLTRGWLRVLGTFAGVVAGVAVATLVDGERVVSVVLLAVFLFLGLYLARVHTALMPFFITAVLALVYGLLGQFDPSLLLLRLEETAIGAGISVLVAFVVLPQRTRVAFADALTAALEGMQEVLDAAADRLVGVAPARSPREAARAMHPLLVTVRDRAGTLTAPGLRARRGSSRQRIQRVASVCDHWVRALARASETAPDPRWAPALRPAVRRVVVGLDDLAALVAEGTSPTGDGNGPRAEELLEAAERGCRDTGPDDGRDARLAVVDLLRRINATVDALVHDLDPGDHLGDVASAPVGGVPTVHGR